MLKFVTCYPDRIRTCSDRTKICCTTNYTTGQFVFLTGLEPARHETSDPKSDASTNSATGTVVASAGLEPARAQCPRDFKSLVSTIPP